MPAFHQTSILDLGELILLSKKDLVLAVTGVNFGILKLSEPEKT